MIPEGVNIFGNNPFKYIDESQNTDNEFNAPSQLCQEDLPEGFEITPEVWEKLQILRCDKIKREYEIAKVMNDVKEMKGVLNEIAQDEKTFFLRSNLRRNVYKILMSEKKCFKSKYSSSCQTGTR